jgi:hypothetical protein
MTAVERLGYRATVGDVAASAGISLMLAQQGLVALASETSGHLQVAESGDVVYQFSPKFRDILRQKFIQIQLKEWGERVWHIVFYLVRLSFGIALMASIVLIAITISIIVFSINRWGDSDNSSDDGGFWFPSDFGWIFDPNPYPSYDQTSQRESHPSEKADMNFLEAVFSFLFGDGNPNAKLEDRRWQLISDVIRRHQGAIAAEQVAPYLDNLGNSIALGDEDYILPVLSRYNGKPEVSPEGDIIYHFPDLQKTANRLESQEIPTHLNETSWAFSRATSGQILLALGLGGANLIGALVLGQLLASAVGAGGFVAWVASLYGLLLAYGIGFLAIPLGRYGWIQWRNDKIAVRNRQRQRQAERLNDLLPQLRNKLSFAQQFAAETIITKADLIYTTEEDLLPQEVAQRDRVDQEWQQRLERRN